MTVKERAEKIVKEFIRLGGRWCSHTPNHAQDEDMVIICPKCSSVEIALALTDQKERDARVAEKYQAQCSKKPHTTFDKAGILVASSIATAIRKGER